MTLFHIRSILLRKLALEGRHLEFRFRDACFVFGGLQLGGNILTAAEQSNAQQRGQSQGRGHNSLRVLPS